jgi:class 3 adenylate cyclase/tetratricopeptide (TPR) repeat protein
MAEERRIVTVLFARVTGMEKLPEARSAEEYSELVDALFTRLRRAIEARAGTVDKFAGETVMAVFGAPVAHEDDPLRAVRAALAMKRETDLYAAAEGVDLSLRAGVNMGEVLWGSVGGDRPTAMGDVVNVASRLESSAGAGQIVVTRPVERASSDRIEYRKLEELPIRGRQEKVQVYEARSERSGGSSAPRPRLGVSRMVGRASELESLAGLFQGGRGAFAVVEGESGLGKTRLLHEVRERIRNSGRPAWIGVGHAIEGSQLPLAPFAEILREAVHRAGAAPGHATGHGTTQWISGVLAQTVSGEGERAGVSHLIAQSVGQSVQDTRVRYLEPGRVKQETLYAWERWIRSLAAREPVLFCIEDLQDADLGTLSLLEYLPQRLGGLPVCVLVTARPGARLPAGYERVLLGELKPAEAGALASELLGRTLLPELEQFLVERSGGNPHYVEELVRHLVEEGHVSGNPAGFASRPDRLPDGLRGLLVARIDAVSPDAREALKGGSVFGKVFWRDALGFLLGRNAAPPLLQAERRQLIAGQNSSFLPEDTEYHFRQAPVRDAAYSLLTRKERHRLHAKAADLLEGRAQELGRRALILAANHRECAEQPAEAAALWEKAGREAAEACAFEESLELAREAQRLGAGAIATLLATRALAVLGLYEQSQAEAEELAATPGITREHLGLAKLRILTALERRGRFAEAMAVADELLEGDFPPGTKEDALWNRAGLLIRQSRLDEALALSREQLAKMESRVAAGDADGARRQTNALNNIGRILRRQGKPAEALEMHRRSLALNEERGFRTAVASDQNVIGLALQNLGRREEALEWYQRSLTAYREFGDRWGIAMCLTNVGLVLHELGRHAEAWAANEEGLRIRRDIGDRWGESLFLNNMSNHHYLEGRLDRADEMVREALAAKQEVKDRAGEASAWMVVARIAAARGKSAEALAAVARLKEIDGERDLAARQLEGELLALAGREQEAAATFEAVAQDAATQRVARFECEACGFLALLHARSRSDEARRLLERALRLAGDSKPTSLTLAWRALGAAFGIASAGSMDEALKAGRELVSMEGRVFVLGAAAAGRAASGNPEAARMLAEEAAALATAHGMPAHAVAVRRRSQQAGPFGPGPAV